MLFDDFKEENITMGGLAPGYLNDAIVFKIDERASDFYYSATDFQRDENNEICIPSLLPYNNMALNFNDAMIWFTQNFPDDNNKGDEGAILQAPALFEKGDTQFIKENKQRRGEVEWECDWFFAFHLESNFALVDANLISGEMTEEGWAKTYNARELADEQNGMMGYLVAMNNFMTVLNQFLLYLSCKNVTYISNDPPEKVQNKRIKQGKKPLSSYYTLHIKPAISRGDYEKRNLWSNRVHLCRGHMREYTSDRPLFGKYTGRFWVRPHVRGKKEKGVIHKDYQVETA